jgi:two-component system, chemotaxis family, protein-glutamate methylesterase/glutaminase
MKKKIKILIVDDSTFFREALHVYLSKDEDLLVVGEAPDTQSAVLKIEELKPDVITLDIEMPGMSGIEFLRKVMPRFAIPVVVVSSVNGGVFDALSAGALDFVAKPDAKSRMGYDLFINELKVKIKVASTANRSILKSRQAGIETNNGIKSKEHISLVAIGASTGGTEAIYEVVKSLPRDMPGIVIVQHMPPVFTRMYAERLNNSCVLEVKEAENGDQVKKGRVLIAPGEYQMRVRKVGQEYFVVCNKEERVNGHCPSVDVLFQSVAEKTAGEAVGVILTGMGGDGARGLLEMRQKGSYTIGQDETTSVVYGMPKVAYEIGAVQKQLSLQSISAEIVKAIKDRSL